MRRKRPKPVRKKFWAINHQIRASEVRVIGKDGKQLGVMSITKARDEAKKANLDLVEIAPKARPPVTQIVDFGKFKYQEEKKLKKQSKGKSRGTEVKEVRFSPFIGEADFNTRLARVNGFLAEGYKVRPVVKFKGRQMGSKQYGYKVLTNLVDNLEHNVVVDMEPKFLGRHLSMVISPSHKARGGNKKEEKKVVVK